MLVGSPPRAKAAQPVPTPQQVTLGEPTSEPAAQEPAVFWRETLGPRLRELVNAVRDGSRELYPIDRLYDPDHLAYNEQALVFEIRELSNVLISVIPGREREGFAVLAGWEKVRRLRRIGTPAVPVYEVPFHPLMHILAAFVDVVMFGRSPRWELRVHLALRQLEERSGVRIVRAIATELGVDKGRISRLYRPLPPPVVEALRTNPESDIWQVVELNDSQMNAWLDQRGTANVTVLEQEATAERGPIAAESPLAQLAREHGANRLLKQRFFKDPTGGAEEVTAFIKALRAAGLISGANSPTERAA
ncbi:MAG: hypothetical protein ACRDHX_03570 [Chloroflexota bacterium]